MGIEKLMLYIYGIHVCLVMVAEAGRKAKGRNSIERKAIRVERRQRERRECLGAELGIKVEASLSLLFSVSDLAR